MLPKFKMVERLEDLERWSQELNTIVGELLTQYSVTEHDIVEGGAPWVEYRLNRAEHAARRAKGKVIGLLKACGLRIFVDEERRNGERLVGVWGGAPATGTPLSTASERRGPNGNGRRSEAG